MEAIRNPQPTPQKDLQLIKEVSEIMDEAINEFKERVDAEPYIEVPHEKRSPIVEISRGLIDLKEIPHGWIPNIMEYSSDDPFQKANSGLTLAAQGLIKATAHAAQKASFSQSPHLTYDDSDRAKKGKKATVITKKLASIDPATGLWINSLPDAEQLKPVATPYTDGGAVTISKDHGFSSGVSSKNFLAIVGGANDGRAVREREAVEKAIISEALEGKKLKKLQLTSFGTGTGEAATEVAFDVMSKQAQEFDIHVNGIDINPRSLAVAEFLAANKQLTQLKEGQRLHFEGSNENILSAEGIREAISKTMPDVVEAVGLAEYIPSDNATSVIEQEQRKDAKAKGWISAEEFYQTIWEELPEGSIFISGNMRDDSREASFVIAGLGWKGIIQRPTKEYLTILKNAGIPPEAVTLYAPKQGEESSGVYNIVAIQKPAQ